MIMNRRQNIFPGLLFCMALSGCVEVKQAALYPQPNTEAAEPHIANCYALQIFDDHITNDIWYTQNTSCIQIDELKSGQYAGEGALHIKWNKPQSECDWIGMGVGWDDWFAKDLHQIVDSAAIQFYVRNVSGVTKGLPWAIAFEDYGNAQAWCGMSPNFIENGEITENWTKVTIPLSEFDYDMQEPDMRTVKQMIIQFEGDGEIYLDDIKLVRSSGSTNKSASVYPYIAPFTEGTKNSALVSIPLSFELESGSIGVAYTANQLHVQAKIIDNTPMQNSKSGTDIWNGDAIEIAFATNPEANRLRKTFLLSDKHIGIRCTDKPVIWDWSRNVEIQGEVYITKTADGYVVEASIPWSALDCSPWQAGKWYGFECAIDNGDAKGRLHQTRWNDNYNADFHINPSLWGKIEVNSSWTNWSDIEVK